MNLKETQSRWGNLYRKRYFLDGTRISESYADWLLKHHAWEQIESGKDASGNWFTLWDIGPSMESIEAIQDIAYNQDAY